MLQVSGGDNLAIGVRIPSNVPAWNSFPEVQWIQISLQSWGQLQTVSILADNTTRLGGKIYISLETSPMKYKILNATATAGEMQIAVNRLYAAVLPQVNIEWHLTHPQMRIYLVICKYLCSSCARAVLTLFFMRICYLGICKLNTLVIVYQWKNVQAMVPPPPFLSCSLSLTCSMQHRGCIVLIFLWADCRYMLLSLERMW